MRATSIEVDFDFDRPEIEAVFFTKPQIIETEFDGIPAPASYHGTYSFTPSADTQTIPTAGLLMNENIVVNPIPQNYGLISWNGLGIRVS